MESGPNNQNCEQIKDKVFTGSGSVIKAMKEVSKLRKSNKLANSNISNKTYILSTYLSNDMFHVSKLLFQENKLRFL